MLKRIWKTNACKQINKSKVQFSCTATENYKDTILFTVRLIGSCIPLCLWQTPLHHFRGAPHILGKWIKWKKDLCWLSAKLHPAELEQHHKCFFANSTGSRLQTEQQISLRLHCNSAFDSCMKEWGFADKQQCTHYSPTYIGQLHKTGNVCIHCLLLSAFPMPHFLLTPRLTL